ncbi:hypothetical protein [Croceitalea rosinachiae]|uniref:DUF3575 domain-containing protein n=1 Tax=Croceitalea rosinachiae TaxID=3075596 RepID=A0ABU3A5J3_9FLAO|nr:hypothetical protein [Croceitalea sp. F388]MDT0605436.1 hypothetical protein [Croceitalea sp. F388]
MKVRISALLILLSMLYMNAQTNSDKRTDLGLSLQVYPAGIIPTVNLDHYFNEKSSLLVRAGLNIVDRQDFSDVNVTEKGTGFGGSVGYRKHFPSGKGKFIAGLNLDVWSLNIDWTDLVGGDAFVSGSTYTLVVQPWLEGGYFLPIKNTKSQLGLTLGLGREFNAITSGDEVEQGFIGSVSLQWMFSL